VKVTFLSNIYVMAKELEGMRWRGRPRK